MACVCVPGGIYDMSHVARLQGMVRKHLSRDFIFAPIVKSPWPGWWAKISLFEPGRFSGRVLYLDLDVTITGPLDDLADFDAPFAIIRDWNTKKFNSSVMVWDAGKPDFIHRNFGREVMGRLHGDQGWIHEQYPSAATFPKRWCLSYKRHIKPRLNDSIPQDCRVICYHGLPKPWDLPNEC